MSNKSARAKGYRTTKKTTSGYTEREKKTLIIGGIVILLVVALAIFLPDYIESLKYLRVSGGEVQGVGDNWLIRNVSGNKVPKYLKIAEVEPIPGYTFSRAAKGSHDAQERNLVFTPDAADAPVQSYIAMAGGRNYDEITTDAYGLYMKEELYRSELLSMEVDGKQIRYFVIEYTLDQSKEQDGSDILYLQTVNFYVQSPIDGCCVVLTADNRGADESAFRDRDAMIEVLKEAVKGVTLAGA